MTYSSTEPVGGSSLRESLQRPEGTNQIDWTNLLFIGFFHLIVLGGGFLALLGFIPFFFTWSGLVLMFPMFLFCIWGIAIGYHRLITHKSFEVVEDHKWFEKTLVIFGCFALQGSPIRWSATHRRHHQHTDHEPDPHSPLVEFLWAHMFWLFFKNPALDGDRVFDNTKDLQKDSFLMFLHEHSVWFLIWILHAVFIFALGFCLGLFFGGDVQSGFATAMSWFVWGVLIRAIVVWHVTWGINSVTHFWGYKNYETGDESRNNRWWWLAFGEQLHNNHHKDPCSASNEHEPKERDWNYQAIRFFKWLGLVGRINLPGRNEKKSKDVSL